MGPPSFGQPPKWSRSSKSESREGGRSGQRPIPISRSQRLCGDRQNRPIRATGVSSQTPHPVLLSWPHRASMELWFTARERTVSMDPAVVRAIEELRGLNVAALKTRYLAVFGEESKSSNKQFLFRRIVWRLQAQVEGDLSERARRRAAEIASDADLRTRAPQGIFARECPEPCSVGNRSLAAPAGLAVAGTGVAAYPPARRPPDPRQSARRGPRVRTPALPLPERHRARSHRHALEWALVFWLCAAGIRG